MVSDVRPARERACRCGSPLIFHQVLFFGFSYLSSPYRLVGALVRALSVVVTSGGDPVEALCLEQRREWVEDGGGEAGRCPAPPGQRALPHTGAARRLECS